jgi:hydrogenase nickel incorporation protein HypA/HybF
MHELSIAQNIIEIIQSNIPETEWEHIDKVRLKVGEAAGVVPESLEFSFQAITSESPLRHTQLEIISIPFRVRCQDCSAITKNEAGFAFCEMCGSTNTKVISGNELHVTEIEIREPEKELT